MSLKLLIAWCVFCVVDLVCYAASTVESHHAMGPFRLLPGSGIMSLIKDVGEKRYGVDKGRKNEGKAKG